MKETNLLEAVESKILSEHLSDGSKLYYQHFLTVKLVNNISNYIHSIKWMKHMNKMKFNFNYMLNGLKPGPLEIS